jgi:thiol-disulfide isomerase/thioredoxin
MQRRAWIGGAVAVAAAGLGAWWSSHRGGGITASADSAPSAPPPELWNSRFVNAKGDGTLRLADLRGRPLVLNFWATWCPPCVKEMPELDRFAASQGATGWQVLGLAIDQAAAVQQFLQKTPVRFPVALAGDQGLHWVNALGNAAGGLPFTVVFNGAGEVVHRKLGPTSHDELTGWATAGPKSG